MKHFIKNLSATAAAAALATSTVLSSGVALAATQGTLGATSTGTLNISVTKSNQARITGLVDFTTPAWSVTDGDINYNDTVCIYATSGSYTLKGNSTHANAGNFRLADGGATHFVQYSVKWNDGGVGALAAAGATTLTENTTTATLTNAASDSDTCAGAAPGDTARIDVDILAANLLAVPAGAYTDTLTLLITPV